MLVLVFPVKTVKTVQRDVALTPTKGSSGLKASLAPRPLPPRLAFVEKSLLDVTERSSLLDDNTLHRLLASDTTTLTFFLLTETQNSPESVSHDDW